MKDYNSFAKYYDRAMGDRSEVANTFLSLAKYYAPHARSLLELGCGSGTMLEVFDKRYNCWGVDLSPQMVKEAKRKVPRASVSVGDISKIQFDKKFDLVVCPFDTMNHLRKFQLWDQVFRRAARHLNSNGVFIFDVNTEAKIGRYCDEQPYAEVSDSFTSVLDVNWEKRPYYTVAVKLFEKRSGKNYRLHEMTVYGVVIAIPKIHATLRKYFGSVIAIDPERAKVSKESEELYFVCSKPFEAQKQ